MTPDRVIIFNVWGRFAHFKKIYVTTSALSYGVPFKTSIYGLISAIIGFDNENNGYLNYFNETNCKIGIQIINPIKFQRININLSPSPGPIQDNRKPTLIEYLSEPHYRIYFWHKENEIMANLSNQLKKKESFYTPVLGLAHCLANFSWFGEDNLTKKAGAAIIHTVMPKDQIIEFEQKYWIENDIHIQEQDMFPLEMNKDREVTKRTSILYDINGKPIRAITNEHFELNINGESIGVMLI